MTKHHPRPTPGLRIFTHVTCTTFASDSTTSPSPRNSEAFIVSRAESLNGSQPFFLWMKSLRLSPPPPPRTTRINQATTSLAGLFISSCPFLSPNGGEDQGENLPNFFAQCSPEPR